VNPEELVIGGCMLNPDAIPFAADQLAPEDFAQPVLAEAFRAIVQLRKQGNPVEPFSVWRQCEANGVKNLPVTAVHHWLAQVGSSTSVEYYAREVKETATRRRLTHAGLRYHQSIGDPEIPAAKTVSDMLEALKEIRDGSASATLQAKTLGSILDTPETPEDWVIPNLLEVGDRMIITGYEGLGKTTWIRQMMICAAAGINPSTLNHIAPIPGLVIDVENSEKQWRRETQGIAKTAASYAQSPRDTLRVYCGKRMDIRKDKDLGLIHRLVDEHQPKILSIGPLYRLTPNGINNDEEAAPLIAALDTLRDRGLVLIMEGHSPKGQNGERNLAPRGSAALMGWPEFGFGLKPTETGAEVVRWRGDRDRKREWPRELYKAGVFPWTGDTTNTSARHALYAA
jgi:hypothetical protein